jgi:hypothetical protein
MKKRAKPSDGSVAWPDEPFDDPQFEVARRLAVNLRAAMAGRSSRSVGGDAGVDPRTVDRILAGALWCDIMTLAKLEESLGVDLWPGRIR